MALLGDAFAQEFSNVDPAAGFDPIPAGQYTLKVAKTDMCRTKDGVSEYLKLTFDVIAPTHQGRKLFVNYNIYNASEKARQIALQQLKSLVKAGHVAEPLRDTDQLVGAIVLADVTVREANGNFGPDNQIKRYREVNGAAAQAAPSVPVGDAMPQGSSFSKAFAAPWKN